MSSEPARSTSCLEVDATVVPREAAVEAVGVVGTKERIRLGLGMGTIAREEERAGVQAAVVAAVDAAAVIVIVLMAMVMVTGVKEEEKKSWKMKPPPPEHTLGFR